jgi:uncharacterized membrane protein YoaK (UPF0700 family)
MTGTSPVRNVLVTSQYAVPAVIPPLLAFVAGFIDSYTVLALFGLFVAQVTGSFVLAAVAFVASEQGIVIKVLAIPVFLLAAFVTAVVAILAERRGRSALAVILGFEGLVLAGFFAMLLSAPLRDPNSPVVIAASLAGLFAMGMQSALVCLLMKNVASTNVMTTNTTLLAIGVAELALAWQARRRASDDADAAAAFAGARTQLASLFPIMFGFLLGTAGGTLAYVFAGTLGLLLPLAIVGALFVWAALGRGRC